MNWFNLIYLLAIGAGIGFGIGAVLKAAKSYRSTNPVKDQTNGEATLLNVGKADNQPKRSSNCLSLLSNGTIRLKNGTLVSGFLLESQTTLWSSYGEVDHLYDEIAGMLRASLPIGTGIQFRTSIHPEDSEYLMEQKIALAEKQGILEQAQDVKLAQLDFLGWLSQRKEFRRIVPSMWIYLPLKHEAEAGRNALTEFVSEIRAGGLKSLRRRSTSKIVKRSLDEEQELLKQAEAVFSEIQQMCPMSATRLTREQTWQALYHGYNENAVSFPPAPSSPLINLEPVLCSTEKINATGNWYLLHGNTPVTMLTMFVPPESEGNKRGCYAGMMRHLANNPGLKGRFSILTEFITEDKEKTESDLKRDKWKLKVISTRPSGVQKPDKKKKRAYEEIDAIEEELVSQSEALVKMRLRILVYGNQAFTNEELDASIKELDKLCKDIIKTTRKSWRGADVATEDAIALRALYENTLLGNMEMKGVTGRELKEQAYSYCAFVPAEDSWKGMEKPHTIKKTITGRTFGINLWNNPLTKSPLVCLLGASGTGKSVEAGIFVVDALAEMPNARVKIVDFGETYAPLCEVLGGRHLRFLPDERKTINIWDYKGLEVGEPPEEPQVSLVVEDAMILAGFDPESDIGRVRAGILHKCVVEVYRDFVPRNRQSGGRRHEPVLTNLIGKLRYFPFETSTELEEAAQLASILSVYEGNPWLDAETHEDFRQESRLDVFELDSLHLFPKTVRQVLAFRTGSRVIRSIGEKINGEFTPTLLVFDEMHEYSNPEQSELRVIFRAMEKGARKGRKTNVITILATHGYEDLAHLHGLTKNAGMFIVGKQDDVKMLQEVRKWTNEVAGAVMSVQSEPGSFSQFLVNVGMGDNQRSELIQSDLSPEMLWIMTSEPNERNAREIIKRHFPHFSTLDACRYACGLYPRGLAYEGKTHIDAIHLPLLQPAAESSVAEREPATAQRNKYFESNRAKSKIVETPDNYEKPEFEISDAELEDVFAHII